MPLDFVATATLIPSPPKTADCNNLELLLCEPAAFSGGREGAESVCNLCETTLSFSEDPEDPYNVQRGEGSVRTSHSSDSRLHGKPKSRFYLQGSADRTSRQNRAFQKFN